MKIDALKKVCVVGGGLMGRQIGLNTAIYGYDVYLTDSFAPVLDKVNEWCDTYLAGRVEKGRMTKEETEAVRARFHVVPTLEEAAKDAQLVIEAIIENPDIKKEFLHNLCKIVSEDTVIATNSSYMVSSTFKDDVTNPSRLANLHYFNPALVLKLTEVVQGPHTSDETVEFLMAFSRNTGKVPVHVRKEIEGFICNRIVRAVRTEGCNLVEQGVATPQEVDTAVELGLNYPMGPFRLLDLTGIDLAFDTMNNLYKQNGTKPIGYEIIKAKVDAGELGRKSGKGFYTYDDSKK